MRSMMPYFGPSGPTSRKVVKIMSTYRSTQDIAKLVRETLKKELPGWKFSVVSESYSGGSAITLSLMQGPEEVVEAIQDISYQTGERVVNLLPFQGYAQLNHYQLLASEQGDKRLSNGCVLTPKGWEVMVKAAQILSSEHWDKSDSMIDYFCCNYYMHVQVGKWNKEYTVKEK